ncbi:MAG: hypothetical protein C0483_21170 [Pirellula sp.]|nr:hypothetical protein [Pirellula sp.]
MFRSTLLLGLLILLPPFVGDRAECLALSPEENHPMATQSSVAERYFVIVFSYQDADNHVLKSHTFATFIKASNLGESAAHSQQARLESQTISWLPAKFADTLHLSFFPTAGKNFTLGETLKFARQLDVQVRHWGPLEIDAQLYHQAMLRSEQLASGEVRYQIYDSSKPRTKRAANVVHCIDAVAETAGKLTLGTIRGFEAGEQVAKHFQSHVTRPQSPAWLYDAVVRDAQTSLTPGTLLVGDAQ